jgi:hypothetical protein
MLRHISNLLCYEAVFDHLLNAFLLAGMMHAIKTPVETI